MMTNADDFAYRLRKDLALYLSDLDLTGFSGIAIVDLPDNRMSARVIDRRIEFNRQYFSDQVTRAMQGDAVAYSDLLNTFHHEFCHIDIDNRMPFLVRELTDDEVFPLGIAFRFTREFLACSCSEGSMSVECLKDQITRGTQDINFRLGNRDIKNYCEIVCDLAYLIGQCIHKPYGYFATMCDDLEDELFVALSRQFMRIMSSLEDKLPLESEDSLSPLCDAITLGWSCFKNQEDCK